MKAEQLARLFHETYEELAPNFNYETRRASARPWCDVPENNRNLMIAVAEKILFMQKKMDVHAVKLIEQQDERIAELEKEISKRPAKPLFGEARSCILVAMDNSANVNVAIEKWNKLQERIKELEAGQLDFAKETTRILKAKIQRIKELEEKLKSAGVNT